VAVELDDEALQGLLNGAGQRWRDRIADMARACGLPEAVRFEPYRRGSAFVAEQ
jgi:hypothetical protein